MIYFTSYIIKVCNTKISSFVKQIVNFNKILHLSFFNYKIHYFTKNGKGTSLNSFGEAIEKKLFWKVHVKMELFLLKKCLLKQENNINNNCRWPVNEIPPADIEFWLFF